MKPKQVEEAERYVEFLTQQRNDERGVDYSLWCTVSGSIVGDPSAEVLDALGE